jgi:SHS2 domain-containing protein
VVVGDVTQPVYEQIDHTADAAIVAYGATLEDLFEHTAFGMFDITFDLTDATGAMSRPVVGAGDTVEDLLVAWLSGLLAEAEIHGLAFSTFAVDRLEEGGVQGSAGGDPVAGLELIGAPIKAVTYHDLAVIEIPDGWWARVVFDV